MPLWEWEKIQKMLWSLVFLTSSTKMSLKEMRRVCAPLRAVRHFCLACQGLMAENVSSCPDRDCPLWAWRFPVNQEENANTLRDKSRQALRAIRRQCMCCAESRHEIRTCSARENCELWSFRFGVRPDTYKVVRRRFLSPKFLRLF